MSLLPAIGGLGHFAFRIINVDGDLRRLHFASEPEPVLVSLKQLLAHRFLLPYPQIATPVILANLEAFLDVGLRRLEGERLRIVHRSASGGRNGKNQRDQEARAPR